MLELYTQTLCPYCLRVKRALSALGLDYAEHRVSVFKFRRDEVRAVSGQSQVPVLVDSERGVDGMPESGDIVDYLYETYGEEGDASADAASA